MFGCNTQTLPSSVGKLSDRTSRAMVLTRLVTFVLLQGCSVPGVASGGTLTVRSAHLRATAIIPWPLSFQQMNCNCVSPWQSDRITKKLIWVPYIYQFLGIISGRTAPSRREQSRHSIPCTVGVGRLRVHPSSSPMTWRPGRLRIRRSRAWVRWVYASGHRVRCARATRVHQAPVMVHQQAVKSAAAAAPWWSRIRYEIICWFALVGRLWKHLRAWWWQPLITTPPSFARSLIHRKRDRRVPRFWLPRI
jgi:hypothetical protein